MINITKPNHRIEKLLVDIEVLLNKEEATMDFEDGSLVITSGEWKYVLRDTDNGAHISEIPRAIESERLIIKDRNGW